jgi:hypothetical protein
LCEAVPSSGKGSGLATVVLAAAADVGGVVVGGGRGVNAVVVRMRWLVSPIESSESVSGRAAVPAAGPRRRGS